MAIGVLLGRIAAPPDAFASNSQVTSRISRRLIDLLAALATGTVGAFVLVRADISDTLPGVAIAISLVPPLAVTGLLITVGRHQDAGESALLFATNVAAIVATGTVVFLVFGVRGVAQDSGLAVGRFHGGSLAAMVGLMLLVAVPLTIGTISVARDRSLAADARPIAERWVASGKWQIASVEVRNGIRDADLEPHGRTHWCPADTDICTVRDSAIG
ncbi:DUF389 domain-containing protein [Streptomyces sp. NPDC058548]|uniref:DUF389 domain-containing protein n=1 Tax=unclassified Streptomyces TaxID=2593676 RepID=UPI003654D71E